MAISRKTFTALAAKLALVCGYSLRRRRRSRNPRWKNQASGRWCWACDFAAHGLRAGRANEKYVGYHVEPCERVLKENRAPGQARIYGRDGAEHAALVQKRHAGHWLRPHHQQHSTPAASRLCRDHLRERSAHGSAQGFGSEVHQPAGQTAPLPRPPAPPLCNCCASRSARSAPHQDRAGYTITRASCCWTGRADAFVSTTTCWPG